MKDFCIINHYLFWTLIINSNLSIVAIAQYFGLLQVFELEFKIFLWYCALVEPK